MPKDKNLFPGNYYHETGPGFQQTTG